MDKEKKDNSYLSDPKELFEDAMTVLIRTFKPATKKNATDFFTSKYINSLILDHTGVDIGITEINVFLLSKGYIFIFDDSQFQWLMQKENTNLSTFNSIKDSDKPGPGNEMNITQGENLVELIDNIRFGK